MCVWAPVRVRTIGAFRPLYTTAGRGVAFSVEPCDNGDVMTKLNLRPSCDLYGISAFARETVPASELAQFVKTAWETYVSDDEFAGEDTSAAFESMARYANRHGGGTFVVTVCDGTVTAEPFAGTAGYIVGGLCDPYQQEPIATNARQSLPRELDAHILKRAVYTFSGYLADDSRVLLGIWRNERGRWEVEPVSWVAESDYAHTLGNENRQRFIWDVRARQCVPVTVARTREAASPVAA